MGNDQPALRALFTCESGLSEPEIGLEHAFVLLIWQMKHGKWVKWQNSHAARFAKTTANCSIDIFHLIISVSRPQRPLSLILLTPVPRVGLFARNVAEVVSSV
jgi:hypothetical protein